MGDRNAELIQIKKEEEQLQGILWKYNSQLGNIIKESEGLHSKLSQIEMDCHEKKNQNCLSYYDSYLVALNSIKRKISKVKLDINSQCFEAIPYSLRPQEETKWNVKSQEGLAELRKFVQCSEPLYKEAIRYFYDDLSLRKEVDRKIKELV